MEEHPPIFEAEPACVSSHTSWSSQGFWRFARVVFLGSMAAGFVMTLGMTTVLQSVIDSRIHKLQGVGGEDADRSAQLEAELRSSQQELRDLRSKLLRSKRDHRRLQMEHDSCARTWAVSHAGAHGLTTQILTVAAPSCAAEQVSEDKN